MSLKTKISYWLFNKKNTETTNRKFITWDSIEQISIVLFSSQYKEIKEFTQIAKKSNKQIFLYIIHLDKAPINFSVEEAHSILTKKEFNFFGLLKATFTPLSDNTTNSVLINLGAEKQLQALVVSSYLKAICKIAQFDHSLFDVTITQEKRLSNSDFLKQVIVYLQMIKTS